MRPIETRFGRCAPEVGKAIATLSRTWVETIVPFRPVLLCSGPNRWLHFGASVVELRHAPRWQLMVPHRKAGEIVRGLAWLGPVEVGDGLDAVLPTLSDAERAELAALQVIMPL